MTTDAALVEAARTGDQGAFADLYDRYADRVFSLCATLTRDRGLAEDATADTFLVAWQRLDQLRDPSQVRPWLFAIARNRVTRLGTRAARQRPVDPVADEFARPSADPDTDVDAQVLGRLDAHAATRLVWEAADGLNDNERAVLELSVRQGLEGEELAAALGTTRHHANVVASRMRTNLERSVGALYLLGVGAGDCDELEALVEGYEGALTPLWRKRISRHADACETCGRSRSIKPAALFAALPVFAAPATARAQVLSQLPTAPGGAPTFDHRTYRADRAGFPRGAAAARRRAALVTGVAVAVLAVVAWVAWPRDGGTDVAAGAPVPTTAEARTTPTAPATTEPDRSTTTEVPGSTTTTASPTTSVAEPPAGPGTTTPVADPPADAPPPAAPPPSVVLSPAPNDTTTTAPDTAPPVISDVAVNPTSLKQTGCAGGSQTATVTVTAQDDRGVVGGQAEVRVGPSTTTVNLSGAGSVVSGTIGPFANSGSLEVTVRWVADAAGNRSGGASPVFGAVTC